MFIYRHKWFFGVVAALIATLSFGNIGFAPHQAAAATRAATGGPTITVTPNKVAPGDQVTVSGSGFGPNAGLTIIISGQGPRIGYVVADSNGNMPLTRVTIPSTLAPGMHTLGVVNAGAQRGASAQLTLANPVVTVTPGTVAPGGRVTVSGSGFAPNAGLTIIISGQQARIGYALADGNGNLPPTQVTIPTTLVSGTHTLSVVNAAAHNGGSARLVVGQGSAKISVTPGTVAPGDQVTVSGSGFSPNAGLTIIVSGYGPRIGYVVADANGNMPATKVTIPSTVPLGSQIVSVVNASAHRGASTPLIVANPMVNVTPNRVAPGGQVMVSGSGFAPNAGLTIIISGQQARIGYAIADSNGNLPPTQVTIPASLAMGVHTLSVVNASAHNGGGAQLVVGSGAIISVTPNTVAAGGQVTVSGSGFAPNAGLTIIISGQGPRIGYAVADGNGNLTPISVTIPSTLAPGAHTLSVDNAAAHTGTSAPLSVTKAPQTVTVNPSSIAPGGRVTVTGSGFAPNAPLTIIISGYGPRIGFATADANGNLAPVSVTIPPTLSSGVHTLSVVNAGAHVGASTQLTLTVPLHATLAVTPSQTNRGGLVTVSGSNFAANEPVQVAISGVITPLATITATAQGVLTPTGVSIPYSASVGAHTLTVTGTHSQRTATATIGIASLTPSISLSAPSGSPGATVTVTGRGFGRNEQVTVSLNGQSLPTVPSVITATNGVFTAAITLPNGLLNGANTISAIGNESRVSAVAVLTGALPVASTLYFAGASTVAGDSARIAILNTHAQRAHITMTFYYQTGAPGHGSIDVAATSRGTADLNALAGGNRVFGVKLVADRSVSASLHETRPGRDGVTLLGVPAPSRTWYAAEGYTGLTFHEKLALVNPGALIAQVQLRLLPFGGRPSRTVAIIVAPRSTRLVDVNALMPGQSLSVIANASQPIVFERTLTFSTNGYGMTAKTGTNAPATSWLFAEGTTTTRFQTFLTILNPNAAGTTVTASFYGQNGANLGNRTIYVPGLSRANIKLNDFLHASGIATVVTSNLPVVAERPEYFGSPNAPYVAGSDVFGRNGAGLSWTFPGGDTANRSEFLLIYNPSSTTAVITATFYGSNGSMVTKQIAVPPTVRYNVDVNRLVPGITPQHGITLRSANGVGFVAEQTVFAPNYSALSSTEGFAS